MFNQNLNKVFKLTLFLSATPYTLLCSFLIWEFFLKFQTLDITIVVFFPFVFLVYLLPFLYFMNKDGSITKALKLAIRSRGLGLINLTLVSTLLFIALGFYICLIGKLIALEGLVQFLKHSFLPPLFAVYLLPFLCLSVSNNKDGKGLNNFISNLSGVRN